MRETKPATTSADDDGESPIVLGTRIESGEPTFVLEVPPSVAPERILGRWAAWADYYATGEGRIPMVCIGIARTADEICAHFGNVFGPWYVTRCDVAPGGARNELTLLPWNAEVIDMNEVLAARAATVCEQSWFACNHSQGATNATVV